MTRFSVLLVCLFFGSVGFAQQTPSPNEALARTLIEKSRSVFQNMKSKDVRALNALLSNDFRIVWSDGKLHEKGELLGAAQEGDLRDFQFYSPEVVPVDHDSVLVTFNLIVNMPEGDEPGMAPRYQRVSDLWIRQGDDWLLKFEQATPVRPID